MRGNRASIGVVALLLVALAAMGCTTDTHVTVDQVQQTGIAVSGTGSVTVVPDIGVLNLGVEASRPTVADARSVAASAMDAVRGALRQNGVDEKDIATQFFNIQPQYSVEPLDRSGTPRITGYTVSNQVTVKVRRIDNVSRVLDAAVAAGGDATRVNGVSFTVDDPEKYESEAREKAVAEAKARAEQLAKLAGVSLGDARSIEESRNDGGGADFRSAQPAAGGETPISPGETQVTLTVNVIYNVK